MTAPPCRLVTAERREDDAGEMSLRPQKLSEFIGQEQAAGSRATPKVQSRELIGEALV
jgi:Holliday junction resolvasome RuvABC ATP-dependent DNA helicase subunit